MAVETRRHSKCFIFDDPCELDDSQLPSYGAVIKYYLFVRNDMKNDTGRDLPIFYIAKEVAEKMQAIYNKASIPCVTKTRNIAKIKQYHKKYQGLLKSNRSTKNSAAFQTKMDNFKNESNKLFDFASCKCKVIEKCKCAKEFKIPPLKREFMKHQRTDRKMFIGSCGLAVTKLLRKRALRCEQRSKLLASPSPSEQNSSTSAEEFSFEDFPLSSRTTSPKRKAPEVDIEPSQSPKRPHLSNLALACERTGVSDRAAAMIASSVLQHYGIITPDISRHMVDRSKIRRSRNDIRKQVSSLAKNRAPKTEGIYFDGRKDQTLVNTKKGDTFHRSNVMEEHITLISEPDSRYLSHVSVTQGSSECITATIWEFLKEQDGLTDSIRAIGCDGTVVNTGTKGEIITLLESKLSRSLHWFVCQLHANELPLRLLIQKLDGKTTGPREYTGEIGKQLEYCETFPVQKFAAIKKEMPQVSEETKRNLSTDQKYLYDIVKAVETGHVSEKLADLRPGKMAHSRWLTTANRIMRLYVKRVFCAPGKHSYCHGQ